MPLHHYLPATYLASFSSDKSTSPRRQRLLAVGDKIDERTFVAPAARVGAVNNLYAFVDQTQESELVEEIWANYEGRLSEAINLLINGKINAVTWVRVLVPFAACMMVRGLDFDARFTRRIRGLGFDPESDWISPDNITGARLFELQRLLGPVAVAKWIVITVHGPEPLITNDLGYAPFANPWIGETGMAIPLDHNHVLALIPRIEGTVVTVDSGEWKPMIEHVDNEPGNHMGLNLTLANNAQRFIFGPSEDIVQRYLSRAQPSAGFPEPIHLGFIAGRLARAHEFTWHRLAAALERDPNDGEPWDFPLDIDRLSKGWAPAMIFPTNLLEFPPALERISESIRAHFYDPEIYYTLSLVKQMEMMGEFENLVEEATKGLESAENLEHKVTLLVSRATGLDELGRSDEALRDYDEAIHLDPSLAVAHANKGYILLNLDRPNEAINCFSEALKHRPDLTEARMNRGVALSAIGQQAQALEDLSSAIDSFPHGSARGAAYLNRGNTLVLTEEYQESIKDFTQAISEYPDSPEKALCHLRRSEAYMMSGNLIDSLEDLNTVIELSPDLTKAYLLRSQIHAGTGQMQLAIEDLSTAIELAKDNETKALALWQRAIRLSESEELERALLDFDLSTDLDPSNHALHYDKGLTLLMLANFPQALDEFDLALLHDPQNAKAYNNKAIGLAAQGNHEEAIRHFIEAVRLFGDDPEAASAYRNLAVSSSILGRFEAADESIACVEELVDEDLLTFVAKGQVEFYRGDYELSIHLHRRALKSSSLPESTNPYILFPLLCLGDASKGLSVLRAFLETAPPPLPIFQVLMQLRLLRNRSPEMKGVEEAIALLENSYGRNN